MKGILAIFIFIWTTLLASAQLSSSWTSNIPASKLPSNANIPTVAKLTDPQRIAFTVDVPGSLDNANDSTAVAAIGAAVQTKLLTYYVVPVYGIDTSLDVTDRILITEIKRRYDTFEPGDMKNQYKVANDIFRVKGYFEWTVAD